ncbi:hypothetical protein [Azospirillum brasilense]|nr:hypothetical protein [Azospirillum brasilense]
MKSSEVRGVCRENIESLEHWLRRLIDEVLLSAYGDYLNYQDANGNRIIKTKLVQDIMNRRAREPERYPRPVDAILLDDAIDIICKPDLYNNHFRKALDIAFPNGCQEARTFLQRIAAPRNNLAHANPISIRHAEQIICYTHDVIDSLKAYYEAIGMREEYNAPLILKVTDSFGASYVRQQCGVVHDGGITLSFYDNPQNSLRPGDNLTIEVEVDPSFSPDDYAISWASTKTIPNCNRPVLHLKIENKHVGQRFDIQCRITAKRDWHRMAMGADDFLIMYYKVLPPIA